MRIILTILLAALPVSPIRAESATGTEAAGEETSGPKSEAVAAAHEVSERLTVTATRLRDEPGRAERFPAHATVLDEDDISESGVVTLQDLLSLESGVVLYDEVGNDVSKTLDLRGFSSGTGTRVFLDGVPLNQTRNNALALELVPVSALERVEVVRGSTGTLAGGGSQAGVVNLFTRGGGFEEGLGGSVWLGAGTYSTSRYGGELQFRGGRSDLLILGSRSETGGFRENAEADLRNLSGSFGFDLGSDGGADRRLSLTLIDGRAALGSPGALTPEEIADDPTAAPFNSLDGIDERFGLASLNFRGAVGGTFRVSANLYHRDLGAEILSTGRSAPVFGGFFTDAGSSAWGTVAQASHRWEGDRTDNDLAFGLEWLDGDTVSRGWFTPPADPGFVDRSALASDNTADRETGAFFLQDTWHPSPRWSLTAGLRFDRDRFSYDETAPNPGNKEEREFEDLSLRAGVNWSPGGGTTLFAAYGEAFLPPTVEQLFAFPLFGSNPALEPEGSSSLELGAIWRLARARNVDLTLFQVDTSNEIVFDPDSPLGLFGANINAGETRRRGLEADFVGPVLRRSGGLGLDLFSHLTLVDAEFTNGPNRGKTVPLVPRERFSLGLDATLPVGLGLRVEGLWVGEQVLANDEANGQERLGDYSVLNARLSWSVGDWRRGGAGVALGGLTLFLEARNLLDSSYATRGIYAFDFSTFQNEVFLTPAPDRRVLAGLRWNL